MKKTSKIISLLLAAVLAFSALGLPASAGAIDTETYGTVEALIQNDSLASLFGYLAAKISADPETLLPTLLRCAFLLTDNADLNALVGEREVAALMPAELSEVFVNWLDGTILPEVNATFQEWDVNQILKSEFSGLQMDLSSVQRVYDSLAQLDSDPIPGLLQKYGGELKDLNVSAVKDVNVASDYFNALLQGIAFLSDNLGIVQSFILGNPDFGMLTFLSKDLKDFLDCVKELPVLIKSYLYLLIEPEAEPGRLAKEETRGVWQYTDYADFTADQLFAAALIQWVSGRDVVFDIVDAEEADALLDSSVSGLLAQYGPALFEKYIGNTLTALIGLQLDHAPECVVDLFVSPFPALTAARFEDLFAGAADGGFLSQINNVLVRAAETVLQPPVFGALGLTAGDNSNLNENLTKIARSALSFLIENETALGIALPEEIRQASPAAMSLPSLAAAILKAVFPKVFGGSAAYSQSAVDAADTLHALIALAVNYIAHFSGSPQADAAAGALSADAVKDMSADEATDLVLAGGAAIVIGAVKDHKDELHISETDLDADWETAMIRIENRVLDLIGGFPAAAGVHDLKNQNDYGPFYKLNVLLNTFFDFSSLSGFGDVTFKLDLYTLLKEGLLKNLYQADIAAIIEIFEPLKSGCDLLNGRVGSSLITLADRVLTALFEHSCGAHGNTVLKQDDPADPCTKEIIDTYDYCKICGAYFSYTHTAVDKDPPTHQYGAPVQISAATCTAPAIEESVCAVCGDQKRETIGSPLPHTPGAVVKENETAPSCTAEGGWDEVKYCTVCGQELSRIHKTGEKLAHTLSAAIKENEVPATCTAEGRFDEVVYCSVCNQELARRHNVVEKLPHTPGEPVKENGVPATCASAGSYDTVVYCTVCNAEVSREHKNVEIDPEAHAWGDWTTLNDTQHQRVCANSASHVQTAPHEWDAGTVTETPTAEKAGERTYTCAVCGETRTEPIEKLPEPTPQYTPGDVNGDGKVTAADARLALRRAVGLETYEPGSAKFLACDVSGDGRVTAADARKILRAAVGLEKLSV